MDFFPNGFPAQARARVEAEKILAYRSLDKQAKKVSSGAAVEVLIRDCILRIFLVFAEELCTFGQENGRTVDRIGSEADAFLRRLAILVAYDKGLGYVRMTSGWNGSLTQDAERQFRQSLKWKKYENLLLKLATQQKEKAMGPSDWHEELRRARNMEDDFGVLTFGRAWDAVSILAQTNDPINQEKRINNLWRMYPEAAKKLGLPKLPASSLSQVDAVNDRAQNSANSAQDVESKSTKAAATGIGGRRVGSISAANERKGRLSDMADPNKLEDRANSLPPDVRRFLDLPESLATQRRAMVDAYIEEVRSKTGKRITRKQIWSRAGYKTRTEFERWERQDPKHPNKAADKIFTRILREKPHLK